MKNIRNVRGITPSGKGISYKRVQAAGFRSGQSSTYTRVGVACFAIAVIGWFLLLHTPVIWPWSLFWIAVLLIWVVIIWTVGDSDSYESYVAQSTPGFDKKAVEQQVHNVIHEHDDH